MALSFISPISVYGYYLRYCYTSSGLSQQSLQIDNDTTLQFWSPSDPHPAKPSLVLIHGFGPAALWQWRKQVQFFAGIFNVYVPDLIFFGESTTKSEKRSEIFQAESVAKLLEKLGVEKYSVAGTSYGGFVAYNIAKMWPDRVEKVVIASSGMNMRKRDNEELVGKAKCEAIGDLMLPQTPSQLRSLIRLAVSFPLLHLVPDIFLNDFINTLYSQNRNNKLELLKGITLAKDQTVHISHLQQEVLIVWGEKDNIFPLEMAKELKGLIGKEVKLETIKGTSHVPQIEKAAQFNKIVHAFLLPSSSPTH
ncbi:alpha/beta-Hydrolases superfamily protein [Euphorbia peplus]|nr:alpha/beta-Hydrolases superfamily protein [Euphorbia peplus]